MAKAKRTAQDTDSVFLARFKKLVGDTATQKDIAEKIGVTRSNVGSILSGQTMPNCDTLMKISTAYGVSVDYLLGVSDIPTTDADIKAVCEYTGLSEKAVKVLAKWRKLSIPHVVSEVLSESDGAPHTAEPNERLVVISQLLENESLIWFAGYLLDLNRNSLDYMDFDSITAENEDEADRLSTQADIMRLRCKDYTDDIINAYDARKFDAEKYDKLRSDAIGIIVQKARERGLLHGKYPTAQE